MALPMSPYKTTPLAPTLQTHSHMQMASIVSRWHRILGYTDVTLTVPSYLQFDWKGTGVTHPSARATFGTYKNKVIFTRENY